MCHASCLLAACPLWLFYPVITITLQCQQISSPCGRFHARLRIRMDQEGRVLEERFRLRKKPDAVIHTGLNSMPATLI